MTKAEIVNGLKAKNKDLLEQYDKAEKTINKLIQQSLDYSNTVDTKEVLQKAMLVFLEKPDSFILTSQFSTFIVGIAKKLWSKELEKRKKDKRKKKGYQEQEKLNKNDNNFEEIRINEETEHLKIIKLRRAFNELSDGCKKIFKLWYQEDKSHKEIASILGITPEASRVKLSRCRDKLPKP